MKIAVAGGTGVLGRRVVQALAAAGDEPVVLARSRGVDLVTGAGTDDVLNGCAAVIDATSVTTMRRANAVEFFDAVTRRLQGMARRAAVPHLVVVSIVGVDHVDYGYYQGKRRQEELLAGGDLPWTVLRATQFHEFAGQVADRGGTGPLAFVPVMLSRPVDAGEVAARLVELAHGTPQGMVEPIAGPENLPMADMVRGYLRARGQRKIVVPVRFPGRVGRQMMDGDLIPADPYLQGTITFADYLATLTPVAAQSDSGPRPASRQ